MANPLKWLQANVSLLALASCTLGMNLLMTLFNFYYVKVFLNRYNISTEWLTLAQTVYMICNFVIGPCIAYALDYGCVAWRNRRRLVLFAGPVMAVIFMLPWFPLYEIRESDDADYWGPGIHLMIVLILWNILFSIVNACNCGLFAEQSVDHHKRVKALTFNQVAASIAAAAVFPVDAISKSVTDFLMFQICCGVVSLVAMACFVFTGLKASDVVAQTGGARVVVIEEKSTTEETAKLTSPIDRQFSATHKQTKLIFITTLDRFPNLKSYLTIVFQIFGTRNFWCAVVGNFMTFLRVIVIYNFIAVYTEGLISSNVLPTGSVVIATFYLISQVTPRIIFIMASPLIKYVGSYKTLLSTLVLTWVNSAVGIYLVVFVSYNALIGFLLVECILVAFQDLFVICYSEVIDQDAKRYSRKLPATTVLFTLVGLFIQPSTALAPMIVVRALNIGDYDHYKEDIRSAPAYTKQVMFLVATCVPAFASIISFVSMCLYKNEKHEHKKRNDVEMAKL